MKAVIIAFLILTAPLSAYAQTAEEWAATAQRRYDAGDFDGAAEAWTTSYDMSKQPGLLYNIAQAHRLGGRCPKALAAYQKFVELDPASPKRSLAEGFVAELAPKCGQKPTNVVVQPKAPEVRPGRSRGRTKRIAGLATTGTGVVLLGLGFYYGHEAGALDDKVTTACAEGCVWQDVRADVERGQRYESRQWILYGVGGAAIVTGSVLYYLGWRDGRHESTVNVAPAAGGAVVSWGGTW